MRQLRAAPGSARPRPQPGFVRGGLTNESRSAPPAQLFSKPIARNWADVGPQDRRGHRSRAPARQSASAASSRGGPAAGRATSQATSSQSGASHQRVDEVIRAGERLQPGAARPGQPASRGRPPRARNGRGTRGPAATTARCSTWTRAISCCVKAVERVHEPAQRRRRASPRPIARASRNSASAERSAPAPRPRCRRGRRCRWPRRRARPSAPPAAGGRRRPGCGGRDGSCSSRTAPTGGARAACASQAMTQPRCSGSPRSGTRSVGASEDGAAHATASTA